MASNPVIGFVRKVLDYEGRFLTWVFHRNDPWYNWVDMSIHDLFRTVWRVYVILTWDVANFSYFVASFSKSVQAEIWWLAYQRIPNAYYAAVRFADHRVRQETRWRRAAVERHWRMTVSLVTRVALILGNRINTEVRDRRSAIDRLRRILTALIEATALILQNHINQEIVNRRNAIDNLRSQLLAIIAKLQAQVNAIIPFVNSQAAAGYNGTRKAQGGIISDLLKDIAVDNPVARDLIGRLVSLILDLIEIDDPAARILGGLLLRQVIDRLGVDKLAGGLADTLISDLLGNGKPKTLKDVETSVGNRLNSTEDQWRQFYANGGDDLETLGTQMRESAALGFTVPLAAYFAGAVANPKGTAAATDAALSPAIRAILGPVVSAFGNL